MEEKAVEGAKKFFDRWCKMAYASGVKIRHKMANTLLVHQMEDL